MQNKLLINTSADAAKSQNLHDLEQDDDDFDRPMNNAMRKIAEDLKRDGIVDP